jgi:hypothetical protein
VVPFDQPSLVTTGRDCCEPVRHRGWPHSLPSLIQASALSCTHKKLNQAHPIDAVTVPGRSEVSVVLRGTLDGCVNALTNSYQSS